MSCERQFTLSEAVAACALLTCETKAFVGLGTDKIISPGAYNVWLTAFAEEFCYCLVVAWDQTYGTIKFYKYNPSTDTLTLKASRASNDLREVVYDATHKVFVTADGFSNPDILIFDPQTEILSVFPSTIDGYVDALVYVPELGKVYGQLGTNGSGFTYIGTIDHTLYAKATGTIGAVNTAVGGDTVEVGGNTYVQGVHFTSAATLAIAVDANGIVDAVASGNDVLLSAPIEGSAGNSITLSLGGGNAGSMTVSGATLANGMDAYELLGTIPLNGAAKPHAYCYAYSPVSACLYGPYITSGKSGLVRFDTASDTATNILTTSFFDAGAIAWDSDRSLLTVHGGILAGTWNVWEVDTSSDTIVRTTDVSPNGCMFRAHYISSLKKVVGIGYGNSGRSLFSYDCLTFTGDLVAEDYDYWNVTVLKDGSVMATAADLLTSEEGVRRRCIT